MKPYDENATCPKCGHGQIATRYHEAELWGCRTCNGVTAEHLRRGCERCYYSWNEAPIQSEPEAVQYNDVDLTLEDQARAILDATRRWASLSDIERNAWREFEEQFYSRLRRVEHVNETQEPDESKTG